MDFGGFILWILMAGACCVGGSLVFVAFLGRWPGRWIGLGVLGAGLTATAAFAIYLHHVYWVDERLVIAAIDGDAARVEALLAAGACPDSEWEGMSAVAAARRGGHADVVAILLRAGAVESPNVLGED